MKIPCGIMSLCQWQGKGSIVFIGVEIQNKVPYVHFNVGNWYSMQELGHSN